MAAGDQEDRSGSSSPKRANRIRSLSLKKDGLKKRPLRAPASKAVKHVVCAGARKTGSSIWSRQKGASSSIVRVRSRHADAQEGQVDDFYVQLSDRQRPQVGALREPSLDDKPRQVPHQLLARLCVGNLDNEMLT